MVNCQAHWRMIGKVMPAWVTTLPLAALLGFAVWRLNKIWSQGLGKRVGKSKDGELGRVDVLYFSSQSGIDP